MMNKNMISSIDVSVIIPTFNRKEILYYCLKALLKQTFSRDRFEILIIDDGSTQDIKSMVEDFDTGPFIRYFRQEKAGQARAENLGIKNARGDILLFLDNDMISVETLIEEHFKYHQKYKNHIVRGSYANTSNYINPEASAEGRFFSTAFFINGNVSIKKSELVKAGMFDEDFKEYGWLDLELGVRLRKNGLSVITNYKAFSYHYQKEFEPEDFPAICKKEIERGHMAVLFYSKHPCLRVKMATMNPLIMFLGRVLYKLDWLNFNKGGKTIDFLYRRKTKWPNKHIVNLAAMAYYVYGVDEALKKMSR